MRMKIGIDIDGVISDFVSSFRKTIKDKYGVEFGYEDIQQHDLYKILGLDEDETKKRIFETFDHDLGFQPGAIKGIKEIFRTHEIIIITARPIEKKQITLDWLKLHDIPYHKILFLDEGEKNTVRELGFDVVIDDNLTEIIKWIGKVPLVLVYNQPWNKSLNIKNHFERVYSWENILERLEKHTS